MSEAEQMICDHCGGPVTQNVHGEVWTTHDALQQRVEELEAALRRICSDPGYGLQGIQEDYGHDANAYNYHAMTYWADRCGNFKSIARAALTPPEQ